MAYPDQSAEKKVAINFKKKRSEKEKGGWRGGHDQRGGRERGRRLRAGCLRRGSPAGERGVGPSGAGHCPRDSRV